jgi:hypothetical protein
LLHRAFSAPSPPVPPGEAVAACLSVTRHAVALPLATELSASLHGIVDPRVTKPEMPWPDWNELTDAALAGVRIAADPSR